MNRNLISFATGLGLMTSTLAAEPCVSNTFDQPLPGAINVKSYVSDVPSARFPAFWQEGNLNGYAYRMFGSGEGTLQPTNASEDWQIMVTCDVTDKTCEVEQLGIPPNDAEIEARKIGNCLIGVELVEVTAGPMPPVPNAEVGPIELPSAIDEVDATRVKTPTACAALPFGDINKVVTLQRLLIIAGHEPGEVDGIWGPRTAAALTAFTQAPAAKPNLQEAITLLEAHICRPQIE